METTEIKTRDGSCPGYVFRPAGGPAPAVLVFMDGRGIRPAMFETFPAKHGWVFRDTPVYDAAPSERPYASLFALLDAKSKG